MAAKGEVAMSEENAELPAFAQRMIKSMRQSVKQRWCEAGNAFFARAIISKDVSIACGEAGFSNAMIFFHNKAAWLLAQGLACFGEGAKYE